MVPMASDHPFETPRLKYLTLRCTVHQPSSLLFQRFGRLLLLAKGGRTANFGDIGQDFHVLIDYFQRNGGPKITPGSNSAQYMLAAIGVAPAAATAIDWPSVWKEVRLLFATTLEMNIRLT